jgi:hypothetical protein
MKLRLNTLLVTALCLSAIDGLSEPIFLTQGSPETDDLPDEVVQAILDSEHGHCLIVVEPKADADPPGSTTQDADKSSKNNVAGKAKTH